MKFNNLIDFEIRILWNLGKSKWTADIPNFPCDLTEGRTIFEALETLEKAIPEIQRDDKESTASIPGSIRSLESGKKETNTRSRGRRPSPKNVDVEALMEGKLTVWETHEVAAVLGYKSSEGFLNAIVRKGKLSPIRRHQKPYSFRRGKVIAYLTGEPEIDFNY